MLRLISHGSRAITARRGGQTIQRSCSGLSSTITEETGDTKGLTFTIPGLDEHELDFLRFQLNELKRIENETPYLFRMKYAPNLMEEVKRIAPEMNEYFDDGKYHKFFHQMAINHPLVTIRTLSALKFLGYPLENLTDEDLRATKNANLMELAALSNELGCEPIVQKVFKKMTKTKVRGSVIRDKIQEISDTLEKLGFWNPEPGGHQSDAQSQFVKSLLESIFMPKNRGIDMMLLERTMIQKCLEYFGYDPKEHEMLQKTLAECKYDSRFEVANQKVPIFLSSNRFLRNVYVTSSLLKAGDSMFTKQSHFTPLLARCPLESLVTLNSAYEVVQESIEDSNHPLMDKDKFLEFFTNSCLHHVTMVHNETNFPSRTRFGLFREMGFSDEDAVTLMLTARRLAPKDKSLKLQPTDAEYPHIMGERRLKLLEKLGDQAEDGKVDPQYLFEQMQGKFDEKEYIQRKIKRSAISDGKGEADDLGQQIENARIDEDSVGGPEGQRQPESVEGSEVQRQPKKVTLSNRYSVLNETIIEALGMVTEDLEVEVKRFTQPMYRKNNVAKPEEIFENYEYLENDRGFSREQIKNAYLLGLLKRQTLDYCLKSLEATDVYAENKTEPWLLQFCLYNMEKLHGFDSHVVCYEQRVALDDERIEESSSAQEQNAEAEDLEEVPSSLALPSQNVFTDDGTSEESFSSFESRDVPMRNPSPLLVKKVVLKGEKSGNMAEVTKNIKDPKLRSMVEKWSSYSTKNNRYLKSSIAQKLKLGVSAYSPPPSSAKLPQLNESSQVRQFSTSSRSFGKDEINDEHPNGKKFGQQLTKFPDQNFYWSYIVWPVLKMSNPINWWKFHAKTADLKDKWDPSFNNVNFMHGSIQAVSTISQLVAKNSFSDLVGLLSQKELERLQTEIETEWSDVERNNFGLEVEEIYAASPVSAMLQSFVFSKFADLDVRFIGVKNENERVSAVVHVFARFSRNYSEGSLPDWTVTKFKVEEFCLTALPPKE